MARGVRTASGWSFAKWLWRIIWWVPPFTPIGIWLSLRHHRWKGQQKAERRMRQMMDEQRRKQPGPGGEPNAVTLDAKKNGS